MSEFTIVGAGMAGLLAAAMLRDECKKVIEKQEKLPNNHNALLRFRSSIVGDTVNIPFTPVDVIKTTDNAHSNPVAAAIAYSLKTTGSITMRSVLSAAEKIERRYIAPMDFISRLRNKVTCKINLGSELKLPGYNLGPIISTMPMPALMLALNYDTSRMPVFRPIEGCVLTAEIKNCDICASIYITDREHLAYRVSITHNRLIAEYAFTTEIGNPMYEMEYLLRLFGLRGKDIANGPIVKPQRYAKILPIDEDERKRFILWASEKHNIYSLGRFATWRPGLLLDDIVNDVRVIQKLANGGTSYNSRLNTKEKVYV